MDCGHKHEKKNDDLKDLVGFYETLLTKDLKTKLAKLRLQTDEDLGEDVLFVLLRRACDKAVSDALVDILDRAKDAEEGRRTALAFAGNLISGIKQSTGPVFAEPPALLTAASASRDHAVSDVVDYEKVERPKTSFVAPALLTGAKNEPRLGDELRREIASADRIDWLVSFIKWNGLRSMLPELKAFADRGGKLRVVTTTYMGASDLEAVKALAELKNAEIRISYRSNQTRHHAKAYLFHRRHGLSTAYVGSANVSHPAMSYGLEWTVKMTESSHADMLESMNALFESYFSDEVEFAPFHLCEEDERRFEDAIAEARGGRKKAYDETGHYFSLDLKPFDYQQEILEAVQAARNVHGESRALVAAATGTGKTMIAAFDYRNWCKAHPNERARLLFIAHTKEILNQARAAFRIVLKNQNFGSIMYSGETPEPNAAHLFLTIQTARSRGIKELFDADYFDYVVIDEFHHACADSYRELIAYLKPKFLLGLTATPWRGDGQDVLGYFNGKIAAKLPLGEAIDRQLLVPFDYLMVTDPAALDGVTWKRGYDEKELESLYIHSATAINRDKVILNAVDDYIRNKENIRALGFCVTKRHAQHMADVFSRAGYQAEVITGETAAGLRQKALEKIAAGKLQFIFSVDVFNEGVDIPSLNTVLFLRPTDSPVVFQQQIGRGLRRADGKEILTVLDFVAVANHKFSYEAKLRALMAEGTGSVRSLVEHADSSLLPAGCRIYFEKVARESVLENIRARTRSNAAFLAESVQDWCVGRLDDDVSLVAYLKAQGMMFADWRRLTAKKRILFSGFLAEMFPDKWSSAKKDVDAARKDNKCFVRLMQMNGFHALSRLLSYLRDMGMTAKTFDVLTPLEKNDWLLLTWAWWERNDAQKGEDKRPKALYEHLTTRPALRQEFIWLFEAMIRDIDFESVWSDSDKAKNRPLELHADYNLRQACAILGDSSAHTVQQGVKWIPQENADAFFVTVHKEAKHFRTSVLYDDFAMSRTSFHWQTQSGTAAGSKTGLRYTAIDFRKENAPQGHLFVRQAPEDEQGNVQPYTYVGRVCCVSSSGSTPMSIVWKLETPLSERLFERFRK